MTKTIFRNTFLVGASVLILCAVLFLCLQYTQLREETYEALREEALYAVHGLTLSGIEYLDSLDHINRITWIDENGTVLYDSEFSDAVANQKEVAEVRQAFASGEGQGIRQSESSGVTTMYYAWRCEDGTILRLSRPMSTLRYALVALSPVVLVFLLVLLISGVLSFRVAKQIVHPINTLDLDHPDETIYPELSPLISRIQEQKITIQEEMEQREQMRREFSANVSHELKTPLASISGFAELMAQGAVPEERTREFAGDIYRESQRMITLVNDIIKLSRLDENGIQTEWETIDLYDLAEDTLDSLRAAADSRNISLKLTGTSGKVQGVWQLLDEMLYNLCDNAIKYNHPGGSVTVNVSSSETDVRVTVTDTGIGIPPEHQKRVFERFYRVDKSHSKEIGGTGLGLSIVKHGALFHHADVNLKSEPGKGTCVELIFQK
ncbi:MAG: two-component sensor histidine kinase [Blautia sp.]|nr:two-component sensor histidine kinase [Blautia sp.]